MRRYIKAELFRNFKRSYFIMLTAVVSILSILLNVLIFTTTNMVESGLGFGIETMIESLSQMFILPIFLVIMFVDMVTMEEFKNGTIKNIVSSGLSREKIVISKIITTGILGIVSASIILVIYFISGFILANKTLDFSEMIYFKKLSMQLLAVIPMWLGAATVSTFCALLIDKQFVSGFVYYIFVSIIPKILVVVGMLVEKNIFVKLGNNIFLYPVISKVASYTNTSEYLLHGIILGISYIVIFTILSIIVFRKKDI